MNKFFLFSVFCLVYVVVMVFIFIFYICMSVGVLYGGDGFGLKRV